MFNHEESEFIRGLASDYEAVLRRQEELNVAPSLNVANRRGDTTRQVGRTDYQMFENLERSVEHEVSHR